MALDNEKWLDMICMFSASLHRCFSWRAAGSALSSFRHQEKPQGTYTDLVIHVYMVLDKPRSKDDKNNCIFPYMQLLLEFVQMYLLQPWAFCFKKKEIVHVHFRSQLYWFYTHILGQSCYVGKAKINIFLILFIEVWSSSLQTWCNQ